MPNLLGSFSRFFKAADLKDGPKTLKIKSVTVENIAQEGQAANKKIVAKFEDEDKALVINKTNYELIADVFESEDTDDWVGGTIVLWFDKSVTHMGERKGGVRVKAAD